MPSCDREVHPVPPVCEGDLGLGESLQQDLGKEEGVFKGQ